MNQPPGKFPTVKWGDLLKSQPWSLGFVLHVWFVFAVVELSLGHSIAPERYARGCEAGVNSCQVGCGLHRL